jgi:hypothetical protein
LVERVKDRMRGFVASAMACAAAEPEPAALAEAMDEDGGYSPAHDPASLVADRHGDAVSYAVSKVPGGGDMLAVVATLAIRCGSDSMLLLYRREDGAWREAMVRRAAPYREVSGGWEDLRFAVSPADGDGRWFVATASTTPWCSSAWQGLPFELARPGPAPDRPDIVFRGKTTVYLGNEDDIELRADAAAFELRHIGASLDPAIHSRRHVRRYAVEGDRVRRVQPVAETVRRLHARLYPDHYPLLDEFASIRGCGGGLTQIEIGAPKEPNWFFFVRGGESGPWTMERAARKPDPACDGG